MANLKFLPIKYLPSPDKFDHIGYLEYEEVEYPKLVYGIWCTFMCYPEIDWTVESIIENIFNNKNLEIHKFLEKYNNKHLDEESWQIFREHLIFMAFKDFNRVFNSDYKIKGIRKWLNYKEAEIELMLINQKENKKED